MAIRYTLREGRITCEDVPAARTADVLPGDRRTVGNLAVVVRGWNTSGPRQPGRRSTEGTAGRPTAADPGSGQVGSAAVHRRASLVFVHPWPEVAARPWGQSSRHRTTATARATAAQRQGQQQQPTQRQWPPPRRRAPCHRQPGSGDPRHRRPPGPRPSRRSARTLRHRPTRGFGHLGGQPTHRRPQGPSKRGGRSRLIDPCDVAFQLDQKEVLSCPLAANSTPLPFTARF